MDILRSRVKAGERAAIAQQGRLQADHEAKKKRLDELMLKLGSEIKAWKEFRNERKKIVVDIKSHDQTRKDKAEERLRHYQRMKEQYVKRHAYPSAGAIAASGYSESIEIARARRECWMGHGFKLKTREEELQVCSWQLQFSLNIVFRFFIIVVDSHASCEQAALMKQGADGT